MKIIKLVLAAILIVFTVVGTIFLFGPNFGYQLIRPDDSDTGSLLLVSASREGDQSTVILLQFAPDLDQSRVLPVGGELKVELIGGYGQYQLGSVWPLLELDKRDPNFQRAVYGFIFNQPIKNVVPLPNLTIQTASKWSIIRQLTEQVLAHPLDLELNRQLVQAIFLIRHHQQVAVTNLQTEAELSMETRTLITAIEDNSEDCAIAVMNASDATGLANRFRQLIEQNGGYVVRVDDAAQELEQSYVVIDQQKGDQCNSTARLLTQLFPFAVKVSRAEDVYTTYRTPMAILLGKDIAEIWGANRP